MDAPTYEHFPRQSWESWHEIEGTEDTGSSEEVVRPISFDADAVVRQAVAQRGTPEDRRSLGLQA